MSYVPVFLRGCLTTRRELLMTTMDDVLDEGKLASVVALRPPRTLA